jgi:hypothetical protein
MSAWPSFVRSTPPRTRVGTTLPLKTSVIVGVRKVESSFDVLLPPTTPAEAPTTCMFGFGCTASARGFTSVLPAAT